MSHRTLVAGLLIAALGPAPAGLAQSTIVLLEKGIYTEQTVGDLDAAIKIYQQILTRDQADRANVVRAQYRLGMCFLKKGQKDQAAAAFEKLIERFPQQAAHVAQARVRLAKLRHAPTAATASAMVVRQVWAGPGVDAEGTVSPDGRYLSFVDWETGDLALRDLAAGQNRRLTNKGTWVENPNEYGGASTISPDGKQVAYLWYDWAKDTPTDLRVVSVAGEDDDSKPRVLYHHEDVAYVEPTCWSPDGKHILAIFGRQDRTNQIVLVSIADGSVRVLKSLDWRDPGRASFSPDGRYIVYDVPAQKDSPERDIFVLTTDGSRETALVEHPAHDGVLGWAPDGKRVLFASDRTGGTDVWVIPVADGRPQGSPELVKKDIGTIEPLGFTRNGSFYYGVIFGMPSGGRDVYVATLDPTGGKLVGPPKKISQRFEGRNRQPDFSPDGRYLAYVSKRGRSQNTLVIRSIQSGKERELSLKLRIRPKQHFRWSPDGRYLLAPGNQKGRYGLYRIDVQTGEVVPLVENFVRTAAWSLDGKAIFYTRRDRPTNSVRILKRDLATGQEKELYRYEVGSGSDFLRVLALSPDGRQLAVCRSHVLQLVPATGGEPRELFRLQPPEQQEGIQIMSVAWMPDGRQLLFTKEGELWRISAQGGKPQSLGLATYKLGAGDTSLSVHPDGRRIAFNTRIYKGEVWVMENFLPELEPAK